MPRHIIRAVLSDPIALQAGDVLQNQGAVPVDIYPQDPATDDAALRLPGDGGAFQVENAVSVRARTFTGSTTLAVIRGF